MNSQIPLKNFFTAKGEAGKQAAGKAGNQAGSYTENQSGSYTENQSGSYTENQSGSQSGFSVIELLIALTLISFLATSLLTIISAGGGAFQGVLDIKTAQSEARVAVSYITVKLRQYSSEGMVSIIPSDSPVGGGNVIKIEGASGSLAGESCFIYYEKPPEGGAAGRLVEKYGLSPEVDNPAGANKIADIIDFVVSYADEEQSVINISVNSGTPEKPVTRGVSIALRS